MSIFILLLRISATSPPGLISKIMFPRITPFYLKILKGYKWTLKNVLIMGKNYTVVVSLKRQQFCSDIGFEFVIFALRNVFIFLFFRKQSQIIHTYGQKQKTFNKN
jgi:hypothetical protein